MIKTMMELFIEIALMITFGFFLQKRKIITRELQDGLSDLLLYAILPISVLGSVNIERTQEMMKSLIQCAIFSTLFYLISFAVAFCVSRKIEMQSGEKNIFILMNMFANVGFLGMPLTEALCGKQGFLLAVIYNLVYQIFLVFLGIPLLKIFRKEQKNVIDWRMLLDPLLIISLIALIIFLSPYQLPEIIQKTCDDIGSMMVPVSMFIIGGDLAEQKWKDIFQDKNAYLVCSFRLLIYPIILLYILKWFKISANVMIPVVLLTAMPCGSLNVILAKEYNCAAEFAARTVILSMILMIITIPCIMIFMGV